MNEIKPDFLRCEYLIDPLGIDVLQPRFSWILKSDKRSQIQTAYRIIVANTKEALDKDVGDLWDSQKVVSDHTTHIVYNGKQLVSQQYCYWKVRVWDKNDEPSEWSKIAYWSMGLLTSEDWKATWIGAPIERKKTVSKRKKYDPSPLLRKYFILPGETKRAILYSSALGEYEVYINGARVGDHILAPEWTDYNKRVQYQTYDVTNILKEGENVIGAVLGDGWYMGKMGPSGGGRFNCYGTERWFILQLSIEYQDDTIVNIISDSDWKCYSDGPIQKADHFMGEEYHVYKEKNGWNKSEYNDSAWKDVTINNDLSIELSAQMNEPLRIIEEIDPISINEPNPGVFVFDLGQNIQGWCKIKLGSDLIEENAIITLKHGEMLKEDGTLYTSNLRSARAKDKYYFHNIVEREFSPHFTYHGFRYIQLTGLKEGVKPNKNMLTGCVISSDCRVVSGFESSNDTLNKLWNNILWTQRDNLISVPTDCPQRDERMGWMGDAQAFCQTSMYNMDMAAFYTKWIRDIRDAQLENGLYPHYVPFPMNEDDIEFKRAGGAAWADCGVILPWRMYLNYSDKTILIEHYESMKKYIDYIQENNPSFIWRRGMGHYFGDWLNGDIIESENYPQKGASVPKLLFTTAYFAQSTLFLSKIAAVLGKTTDSKKYMDLFNNIKAAFENKFVQENGEIKGNSQASYAFSLNFNLIPESLINKTFDHLIKAIEVYDNRISTGFCSTIPMMLELVKYGRLDLAYELALSNKFPSWFYMIEKGGPTTIWERWDGWVPDREPKFQDSGMNSFNHYTFGSIGEWINRIILGINIDEENPGYKHIIIKPRSGGDLTWVKGFYHSIRGKIEVSWNLEQGIFNLDVSIPPNTSASIYIPAENIEKIMENNTPISQLEEIEYVNHKDNMVCIKIKSGSYNFSSIIISR